MTRDEAKQYVNYFHLIEAYANGKIIQKDIGPGKIPIWTNVEPLEFDNYSIRYRIKPEPEYEPFTLSDWEHMVCKDVIKKSTGRPYQVIMLGKDSVEFIDKEHRNITSYSYKYALESFIFADNNKPFGNEKLC
jgi:hypothetical protein